MHFAPWGRQGRLRRNSFGIPEPVARRTTVVARLDLVIVPLDIAFIAVWLGAMGMAGLILSGDPLRVAQALLTVLCGFDLVFSRLNPSLVMVGFWGALMLLTALAFAYLATVRAMEVAEAEPGPPPAAVLFVESAIQLEGPPEPEGTAEEGT